MKEVIIKWERKLKADQFDREKQYLEDNGGIYLWIWPGKYDRVCYVGEATKFRGRFIQHFSMLLGGLYTVFNMTDEDDFVSFLKEHYHDKEFILINEGQYVYIPVFQGEQAKSNSFRRAFLDPEWQDIRRKYLETLEFAFGQLTVNGEENTNSKQRKEVEGALISGLRNKYDEIAKISLQLRNWRKPQIPIGNINRYPTDDMSIQHKGDVAKSLVDTTGIGRKQTIRYS
jgi:hypothetical protein